MLIKLPTILASVFLIQVTWSFQVLVYVPKAVERGTATTLICISDLFTENIYKVTWKKDESKIYRYKPSEIGSEREIFRSPGLTVDERTSNLTHLHIPNVDISTEGLFTCEVESRGPSFATRRNSSELRVYSVPRNADPIRILSPTSRNLKKMDLTCVSSPSYPETHLSWLINGRPAYDAELIPYEVSTQPDQTKVSKLGLKYVSRKEDLYPGNLNFTCLGSIELKYSDSTKPLGRFSSSLTIRPRDSGDSSGDHYTHETMDYSDDSDLSSSSSTSSQPYKGDKKKKKKNSASQESLSLIVLAFHFILFQIIH